MLSIFWVIVYSDSHVFDRISCAAPLRAQAKPLVKKVFSKLRFTVNIVVFILHLVRFNRILWAA